MGVPRTEGPSRALPCLPCPASVLIAAVHAAGLSEGPASPEPDGAECSQVDGSVTQRSCPSYGGPMPLACSPTVENAVLLILPSSSSAPQRATSQPQHQQATCCGQVLRSLWFQRVSSAELGRRAYQEIRQTCRQQGSCCVNPLLLLISCVQFS